MESETREPWWREWPLALAVFTMALALLAHGWLITTLNQPGSLVLLLAIICGVILAAAIAIVRHAEILAHRLGEPAGTLLLTLAITGLEVAMVAFVMSTGSDKPTLARDTMFAVVMLVLNGFMGLALVLGGLRHREQPYNLQSANAFLLMIVPLTTLGLVLPNFTRAGERASRLGAGVHRTDHSAGHRGIACHWPNARARIGCYRHRHAPGHTHHQHPHVLTAANHHSAWLRSLAALRSVSDAAI
jgi:Ca2+/H+ antiporter